MVNESLERLIGKHKVNENFAEKLRVKFSAVTSVDENTFMHFYGLVKKEVGSVAKRNSGNVTKKKVVDMAKKLLNYDDALKYVARNVMDVDASQVLARVDCLERADDFFYRICDIDLYIKGIRNDKVVQYKRHLKKEESLRLERELHKGVYR